MKPRVWIAYDPLVFKEALIQVFRHLDAIEMVDTPADNVDVGVFRLASTGLLQDFFQQRPMPNTKLVVFSPTGDRGYIRLPGEKRWRDVRPFGVHQLIAEVCAGRNLAAGP